MSPFGGKRGGGLVKMFSRLDMDGDGMLSHIEINALLLQKFERLDTNQDGVISSEELTQMSFGHRGNRHHRQY